MADTANKTKATATLRQASRKKEMAAEVARATTTPRKGIELVAKVEAPKKTKAAAKPRKTATKKDSIIAISQPAVVSRESIEQLAYQFWAQRRYQHGKALQDWLRAEQELREQAS
jgi:DNA-binding winged helix-turn-helix (wHTH) protein